ncbi:MAG: helix-turn-helix domain-containing protein [Hominimerdicola sp.]
MVKNSIGDLVKQKRKEKGLTQAQLAEMINADPYYISKIETGKRKPGRKYLSALSNALGVSSDHLLGLDSNIVLHEQVSEIEEILRKLSAKDREWIIRIIHEIADRCDKED